MLNWNRTSTGIFKPPTDNSNNGDPVDPVSIHPRVPSTPAPDVPPPDVYVHARPQSLVPQPLLTVRVNVSVIPQSHRPGRDCGLGIVSNTGGLTPGNLKLNGKKSNID